MGLSDELEGYPAPPSPDAGVVTNVSLAMALCTTNGTLLGPSTAATPIDGHLRQEGGLGGAGGNVWVTYTAVPDEGEAVGIWFLAVGFAWTSPDSPPLPPHALRAADVAPLVDFSCPSPPDFAQVPCGGFLGPGDTLPGSYVAWDPASAAPPTPFTDATPFLLELASHSPAVAVIAPVWAGGIVLLGEQGKLVPLSAYRFSVVAPTPSGGLRVGLRGAPGEDVTLLWGVAPSFPLRAISCTMGANGTATVELVA